MLLGARLLRDGTIDLDQLEAALRAQLKLGGRLGGRLVELGALSFAALGALLGELGGHEVADQARLDAAEPRALATCPPALLRRVTALPLALDPGAPATLTVAMASPGDADARAQLALATGCAIRPLVAPELLLRHAIERVHGRPQTASERPSAPGFVPAAGPTTLLPRAGRTTIPPVKPRLSLTDAMARMGSATTRDEIADTLVHFAAGRAGAALLFLLKEGVAHGWKSGVPTLPDGAFAKLTVQLPSGSLLARANLTRTVARGAPETSDAPLFAALAAGPTPKDALVVPIVVGSRVVNLLAAAAVGGGTLDDGAAEAIVALGVGAEEAYGRLIAARKK